MIIPKFGIDWRLVAGAIALVTTSASSAMTPAEEDFFRCRFPYPPASLQRPSLPVAKYTNEHEGSFEEWIFEPEGQRVFEQTVSFLSYSVDRDSEHENDGHYISVVMPAASWDDIRWLVEQEGFRCSIHPMVATEYSCRLATKNDDRAIMVAKANGVNNRGGLRVGVVFTCGFDLFGKGRLPRG